MTEPDVPRLVQVGRRLRALVHDPRSSVGLWSDLTSPVLRLMDWKPKFGSRAALALIDRMEDRTATREHLEQATDELSDNLAQLERCVAVHGALPPAHVGWIWRVHGALSRAERLLTANTGAPWSNATFSEAQRMRLLEPIEVGAGGRERLRAGHVDVLLEAASHEDQRLDRRRHLLEAAREVLLDTATTPTLDTNQLAARYAYVGRELTRLDRLQAAGADPQVALGYQLREALRRGDSGRAHAVLMALDESAARRGDVTLLQHTGRALGLMWQGRKPETFAPASLQRSGAEILGRSFEQRVRGALARAREEFTTPGAPNLSFAAKLERQLHANQLSPGVEERILRAALSVDGRFELGSVGAPYRAVQEQQRQRSVSFPTPTLTLDQARSVEDLPRALIEDPRALLHDLASGRLLARRYVTEEVERVERDALRSEVRVYVLDGSGSMVGVRAQMRDAILLAELGTLLERFGDADRHTNTVLYYRYFTKTLEAARRVADAHEAIQAIDDVVSTPRSGGTNIELALLSCFEQIRAARDADPDLHRAQIVLVTDGNAPVDLEKLRAAREAAGEVRIGVSVVALGEENPALREMTRIQRLLGEQVFYHFIPDHELAAISTGKAAGDLPVHLPDDLSLKDIGPELLELAEEIQSLERTRDLEAVEQADDYVQSLHEVGLDPQVVLSEAEQAGIEVQRRDRAALDRRMERWFPSALAAAEPATERRLQADASDLETLETTLLGVAHVTDLLRGGSELRQKADAIEILQHMLLDSGLGPWRYDELLRTHPGRLQAALDAVRAALRSR